MTDPAFIEPVLDQALKYIDTRKPLLAAQLAQAKSSAATYYRLGLAKPDGLRALERLVAVRFAQPVVTVSRKPGSGTATTEAVDLNFGWMLGPLADNARFGLQPLVSGENFEGRGPATRLLAGLLDDAARTFPKASQLSVNITFPRSRLGRDVRATFVRGDANAAQHGWVTLESASGATTLPLYRVWVNAGDFSPCRDGRYSFYRDCLPTPGVGRVPQSANPTATQREGCLQHATPTGR